MTIEKSAAGSTLTLLVDGRIDTLTSPELQTAILEAFQGANAVVLDMQNVSYVSSAGLRALLIGQKTATAKRASFELHNVPPPVKAVLDTVGFSKILAIK